MYYDRIEGNLIFTSLGNPPYSGSAQYNNSNLSNITGGSTTVAPFDTINAIDPNLENPYTMSYSVGVQRELPWGIFVEASYVGSLGRHLIRQPDINQPTFQAILANSLLPAPQKLNNNALRPYKGYTSIRMRTSDSTSNYHALQTYATKRKGDFLMTVSYTFSKVLTDASGFNDNPEDAFNRSFNYGPASFDRRHIFAATYTYAPKLFRHSSGFAKALLDGYELSGITRLQSGGYFTITGTTSALFGGRRVDYVGGPVLFPNGDRNAQQWINRAAFALPPDTRRGTSGVGIVEGPGTQSWDFSIRRRIALTERFKLLLQADLFNAFNRANYNNVQTNLSAGGFGTLTSAGPARNIQFGIKLNF
jgi:hypothetical protein